MKKVLLSLVFAFCFVAFSNAQEKVVEKMGLESYEVTYSSLKNTGVGSLALDNLIKKTIIGLLLAVMISIILRKSSK